MWEKLIMNVSCLSAIILALVGIAKLPFNKFKEKYPKRFRATFYLLSLVLVVAGSIIAELFIIEQPLATWSFAALLLGTCAGVFGGYAGYENIGLKSLVKKAISAFKTLSSAYSDSKVVKMIEKVGIDKIDAIASTLTIRPVEATTEVQSETIVETTVKEPTITIENKKEGE